MEHSKDNAIDKRRAAGTVVVIVTCRNGGSRQFGALFAKHIILYLNLASRSRRGQCYTALYRAVEACF
jgi:hypothetical protein